MTTREKVVAKIQEWIGYSESDGRYKKIIDLYNSFSPLPSGVKMLYEWPWCACTWSAVQIACGTTSVAPIEISCERIITEAKKLGCWQENDAYVPKIGDGILYDWQDSGSGDNMGTPDHIGMVTYVGGDVFVVTEGNMSCKVGTRNMTVNGKNIRGFITPNYEKLDGVTSTEVEEEFVVKSKTIYDVAREVIAGSWGNGDSRRAALKKAGWDYLEVCAAVNELMGVKEEQTVSTAMTSDEAHLGKPAGANLFDKTVAGQYKVKTHLNLRIRPGVAEENTVVEIMNPGTIVTCFGYYSEISGYEWLYVKTSAHEGFCQGFHLEKV